MENIEVLPCGTKVKIKLSEQEAIITSINIRYERVSYGATYFSSGEFKTVWVHESELIGGNEDRLRIGFKPI